MNREIRLQSRLSCRLSLMLLIIFAASVSAGAQTSGELRKKYGEPEVIRPKDGLSEVERFKVSQDIKLTVTYAKDGRATELVLEPVKSAAAPVDPGDLMATDVVSDIIKELVPLSLRGELTLALHLNGGDQKLKLAHTGCTGMEIAIYQHVSINVVTWCQGGTFSATIRWEESKYKRPAIDGKGAR